MRQFTIAERLIAVALVPLGLVLAVRYLAAPLAPLVGEAYAEPIVGLVAAGLAGAVLVVMVRSFARPIGVAVEAIDAIARAELNSIPPVSYCRS
jgi:hypothetical protein